MTTWNDLANAIRATGTIDAGLVRSLIEQRAAQDFAAWAAIGLPRSRADVVAEAETLVTLRAKTILDNEIAARLRAALPAGEQWARTAELQAEIAETAIPPRTAEAARLRRAADRLRAVEPFMIAAE